ncbi:hypothetical protein JVX90_05360 [Gordonia sp. PDNC005]|uniref:hypothetical protein n=1 Tax=unclassified Gordonia (in: high G+C Gram-positive bacteria) TaxID=2657482 RepID=UPI001966B9EC|nr:hypothetical protein [Gordonia sp. PDNC005]QRY63646.1 hypothetical protein JVX90_05360 [Gordonia sp. PDNC005]
MGSLAAGSITILDIARHGSRLTLTAEPSALPTAFAGTAFDATFHLETPPWIGDLPAVFLAYGLRSFAAHLRSNDLPLPGRESRDPTWRVADECRTADE